MLLSCCLPLDKHLATSDLNSRWLQSSHLLLIMSGMSRGTKPLLVDCVLKSEVSCCFSKLTLCWSELSLAAVILWTADRFHTVPEVRHDYWLSLLAFWNLVLFLWSEDYVWLEELCRSCYECTRLIPEVADRSMLLLLHNDKDEWTDLKKYVGCVLRIYLLASQSCWSISVAPTS